jgi:hypothetical protein
VARTQASGAGTSEVRLAELVAALSLGVDLGFGQPMDTCFVNARFRFGLPNSAA